MDRHLAYVGMSRHRDRLDMHWSTDDIGDREELARDLGRTRAKDTTMDYEPS
jgi:ATP-dependent exoDNAse (exonuclease V) alpha subunit